LPVLARTLVWIEEAGQIVLVRRTPAGLFGGLWELPPSEGAAALGVLVDPEPGAFHDQTLTHRPLRIAGLRGGLPPARGAPGDPGYDAIRRVAITGAAALGIAASTAAILRMHEDTPWSSIPKPSPSSPRATRRSSRASPGSATTSRTRTSSTRRRGPPR